MTEDSFENPYLGHCDVVVIGAGIIGSMVARELSKFEGRFALLDKESSPGFGVSKAGLSQIHSPDFCPSGTLKGRLCFDTTIRFKKLADELDVPYREVDQLWLALDSSQIMNLEAAKKRGEKYDLKVYKMIGPEKIRELEPHVTRKAMAALYVKSLGVVYPPEWVAFALLENASQNGVHVHLKTLVTNITKKRRSGRLFAGAPILWKESNT